MTVLLSDVFFSNNNSSEMQLSLLLRRKREGAREKVILCEGDHVSQDARYHAFCMFFCFFFFLFSFENSILPG